MTAMKRLAAAVVVALLGATVSPASAQVTPSPAAAPTPTGSSGSMLVWKSVSGSPLQVTGSVLAWDPDMGHAIFYSGISSPAAPDSTWELVDGTWNTLSPAREPGVDPIGMVYDTDLGGLVLVGIPKDSTRRAETWSFDGRNWNRVVTSGPPPARGAAMAYDETTSSVVFFGGLMGGRATNATWVFHGGKWSAGSTQPAPPGLTDAAFGWDAGVDGLVMFGGTPNSTDTWTWSRGKWQQVHAATPASSGRYQIVTDQQQALLLGRDWSGNWHEALFDGVTGAWDLLQPDWPSPPAVAAFLAYYDRPQQEVDAFGGAQPTGSDMTLWKGTPGEQPADPCAIVVAGGQVKTSATFMSFHSEFGVELDGERLSNGQANVNMVADSNRGVELMVGYSGEVDKTTGGNGGSSGGSEGGSGSEGMKVGLSAEAQLLRDSAQGWEWHFPTVSDAQSFITGSAAQWTQHNLVDVVPVIGQWIADQTGQITLPQAEKDYLDSGTAFNLAGSGSIERAGVNGSVGASVGLSQMTGGGLLFDQDSGAATGSTIDFSLPQTLGINGSLGFEFGRIGAGLPVGGGYQQTTTLTGETTFDASGAPTEFKLTNKVEGELSGTAAGDLWDYGSKGVQSTGGVDMETTSGTATEREITLQLKDHPEAIQAVQNFLDAVEHGNPVEQIKTMNALAGVAHQEGDETLLSYQTTGGGSAIGGSYGELLAFGAGGNYDNSVETLVNAQAWNREAGTFIPWTQCLPITPPPQQTMVPPAGDQPSVTGPATVYLGRCFAPGAPLKVEPSNYVYGCDGTGELENMRWTAWTLDHADGTGTDAVNNCVPSCAQGTFSRYPVVVHASSAQKTACGGPFYARLVIAYPNGLPSFIGASGTTHFRGMPAIAYDDLPSLGLSCPGGPSGGQSMTPEQLAKLLNSKGIDCSGFALDSTTDPGAISQGNCGTMPIVIELLQFPSHDAITSQFVPAMQGDHCSENPSYRIPNSYIDGGRWVIYSDDEPTTRHIASVLGLPDTLLCM